jgi:hypothetical protein
MTLIASILIFLILAIFVNFLKISEFYVPFFLVFLIFLIYKVINLFYFFEFSYFTLLLIYLTVLLTSPILYIRPPTLVLINYLNNKKQISAEEVERVLMIDSIQESHSKLTSCKILVRNNELTKIGKFVCCIIHIFEYD